MVQIAGWRRVPGAALNPKPCLDSDTATAAAGVQLQHIIPISRFFGFPIALRARREQYFFQVVFFLPKLLQLCIDGDAAGAAAGELQVSF